MMAPKQAKNFYSLITRFCVAKINTCLHNNDNNNNNNNNNNNKNNNNNNNSKINDDNNDNNNTKKKKKYGIIIAFRLSFINSSKFIKF